MLREDVDASSGALSDELDFGGPVESDMVFALGVPTLIEEVDGRFEVAVNGRGRNFTPKR